MFGPKLTHVFKSRWHALMWSAGVLATAYCSIPAPDNGSESSSDSAAQQQAEAQQAQQIVAAWSNATSGK